jgi:hypothetical protein
MGRVVAAGLLPAAAAHITGGVAAAAKRPAAKFAESSTSFASLPRDERELR